MLNYNIAWNKPFRCFCSIKLDAIMALLLFYVFFPNEDNFVYNLKLWMLTIG